MTTTTLFRDYNAGLPEGGEFSINTDRPLAEIVMEFGGLRLSDKLSPTSARDMGTFIIHCAGNPSLHAEAQFVGASYGRAFNVHVVDGDVWFALCADGEEIDGCDPDPFVEFQLSADQAVDLGQRLIVWAGVQTASGKD